MKTLIPNALREYRKLNNLRQIDVAQKLGFCTTDRISRWEKGMTFPHITNLFKLSVLYQVPPHELYQELLLTIQQQLTGEKR